MRLNHNLWQLEPHHVDLARPSLRLPKRTVPSPTAAVQEVQLAIAAKPDAIDVDFWRAALGYSVRCSVRFTPIDARLIEGTPDAPTTFPLPVTDVTRRADPTRLLDWPVRGCSRTRCIGWRVRPWQVGAVCCPVLGARE